MKRRIIPLALVIIIVLLIAPFEAFAEDGSDLTVYFTGGEIKYEGGEPVSIRPDLFPGQEVTYTVTIRNDARIDSDWYMLNDIISSFEDAGKASGGAYEYSLTLTDPSGSERTVFSSERTGSGADSSSQGLHQIPDALKDYFFLVKLAPGESAAVTMRMRLDPEASNSYMRSEASLEFVFRVVTVETPVPQPDTGLKDRQAAVWLAAAASFLCLVMTLYISVRRGRSGGERS